MVSYPLLATTSTIAERSLQILEGGIAVANNIGRNARKLDQLQHYTGLR